MERILIVGSGGAGKTTLARQLAERLNLEIIHLDQYYWNSGWRECSPDEWNAKVEKLIARERWVMDGNYSGTLEIRARVADVIIFLDFSRWTCLWGIIKRRIQFHGQTRPSMPENCPEKIDAEFFWYVWHYRKTRSPVMLERIRQYEAVGKKVFIFQTRRQLQQWFDTIR